MALVLALIAGGAGTTYTAGSAEAAVGGIDAEERAALEALNRERVAAGLAPVQVSPSLTAAAVWMAADLAQRGFLDHTDSQGRSLRTRLSAFGYPARSSIRENIAAGYPTGERVMTGWMNSSGHRANNLASDARVVGIARVFSDDSRYGWFWALTFGSVADAGSVPVSQTTSTEQAAPAPSTPAPSEVRLAIWQGGSAQERARDEAIRSVFVTVGDGLIGYLAGAPDFVNRAFLAAFPGSVVPAGTPVLVMRE